MHGHQSVQSKEGRPRPQFRKIASFGTGGSSRSTKRPKESSQRPTRVTHGPEVVEGSPSSSPTSSTPSLTTSTGLTRPIVGRYEDHPHLSVEWNVVLRAALDPTISTRALRLLAGLYDDVSGLAARYMEDGGVAYLDNAKFEALTGLNHAARREVEGEVAERLGLITQVSRGRRRLVDDKNVGEAGGWITIDPVAQAHHLAEDIDLRGAAKILHPSRTCWGDGRHMVWRLAVCLVATKGVAVLADIEAVPSAEIREVLGIGKSNVARLRRSLIEALALEDRDAYRQTAEQARHQAWVLGRRLARGDVIEEPKESSAPILRVPEVSMRDALARREADLFEGTSTSDHLAKPRSLTDVTLLPEPGWMRVAEYCGNPSEEPITVDGLVLPCPAVLEDIDGLRALIHSGDIPIRVWALNALPAGVAYLIEVRGDGDVVAVLARDFIANRLETDTCFRTEAGTEYRFNHLPTYRDLALAVLHPERSRV